MQQVAGAWTLTSAAEFTPDGMKNEPWSAGKLILDPSGHMSFFVLAPERKSDGSLDPRKPAGPMVAYYGTWTADDLNKKLTFHVENASSPSLSGATRIQRVEEVTADNLITSGLLVTTPEGTIKTLNEWRRAK